ALVSSSSSFSTATCLPFSTSNPRTRSLRSTTSSSVGQYHCIWTRLPHFSCSQWKLTCDSRRLVEYSFTGMVTSPKLRDAVEIDRAAMAGRSATAAPDRHWYSGGDAGGAPDPAANVAVGRRRIAARGGRGVAVTRGDRRRRAAAEQRRGRQLHPGARIDL